MNCTGYDVISQFYLKPIETYIVNKYMYNASEKAFYAEMKSFTAKASILSFKGSSS